MFKEVLEILAKGTIGEAFGFVRSLITTKGDKMKFLEQVNDKIVHSNDQTAEFRAKLLELQQLVLQLDFADTADARSMNVKIQEADKASWLAKNINALLAIVFVTCFVILNTVLIAYPTKVPEARVMLILQGVTNIVVLIIGFYFGSSKSSAEKQKALESAMNTSSVEKELKTDTKQV